MKETRGFTLIELLIVLLILSIFVFISAPKMVSFLPSKRAESFIFKLQETLKYLSDISVLKKKFYLFIFDLDKRSYYFRVLEEGNQEGKVRDRYLNEVKLPDNVKIREVIMQPGGRVYEGRMIIPFTPKGIMYSFVIKLEDNNRIYIVEADSITSVVKTEVMER